MVCFPHLNFQTCSEPGVFLTFWLPNVLRTSSHHSRAHFFDISTSKSAPNLKFFIILTSKRASRHGHVHFFDISANLHFQKCSEHEAFWHFDFVNVLRATTACNFWSLISPDASAPAALACLLCDPQEPQNRVRCYFSTFSRALIFFLLIFLPLTLSLLCLFPPLLFHLSILSEVSLLNFIRAYDWQTYPHPNNVHQLPRIAWYPPQIKYANCSGGFFFAVNSRKRLGESQGSLFAKNLYITFNHRKHEIMYIPDDSLWPCLCFLLSGL